ncbi:hypothetical protein HK101_009886, partial [Irineochytrium annulatum]
MKSKAVVGIDFGTSNSGFCFFIPAANSSQPGASPPSIMFNKRWPHTDGITTDTAILLRRTHPGRSHITVDIGRKAVDAVAKLSAADRLQHVFLRGFKGAMGGGENGVLKDDVAGESMNTVEVVGRYLGAMKEGMSISLIMAYDPKAVHSIVWAIGVPATWSASAKGLFVEACGRAGFDEAGNTLVCVPETKAAAAAVLEDGEWAIGDVCVIVDCGAGGVQVSCNEVMNRYVERERTVLPPSGLPCGSAEVDRAFERLVEDLIWSAMGNRGELTRRGDWKELMAEWRRKKTKFDGRDDVS